MVKLSGRQKAILGFVKRYIDDHQYPPTIREICRGTGMSSTSVVSYNLVRLEREGLIRRDRGVSRGIVVMGSEEG